MRPEHVAGQLRARRVVAHERHPAVGQHVARLRLGGVVQERGPAHRLPARELVRRAARRAARDLVVEARGDRIALQQRDRVEHLERVVVDVEVVEVALLDPAQRAQLGQHDRGQPVRVHQRPARAGRRRRRSTRLSSANTRSAATRSIPGALADAAAPGRRVDLEVELDRDPDRPQAAQRVLLRAPAALTIRTSRRSRSAAPAVRVDQLAAAERLGHRVDREVALGEVGVDVVVAQRHEVDVPRVLAARPPARRRTRR